MLITELPVELIGRVLSFLDATHIFRLHAVHRRLHRAIIAFSNSLANFGDVEITVALSPLNEDRSFGFNRQEISYQCFFSRTVSSWNLPIRDQIYRLEKIVKTNYSGAHQYWHYRIRLLGEPGRPWTELRPSLTVLLRLLFLHYKPTSMYCTSDTIQLLEVVDILPDSLERVEFAEQDFTDYKEWEFLAAINLTQNLSILLLTVKNSVSQQFYRNPVVQSVDELRVCEKAGTSHITDTEFCAASWRLFRAEKRTEVTAVGVNTVIREWIDGKREIEKLELFFTRPNSPTIEEVVKDLELQVRDITLGWGPRRIFLLETRGERKLKLSGNVFTDAVDSSRERFYNLIIQRRV